MTMAYDFILDRDPAEISTHSYGILLFDKGILFGQKPKVLFVRRADSYYFSALILRMYRWTDLNKHYASQLTKREQQLILDDQVNFEALFRNANHERFLLVQEDSIKKQIAKRKDKFDEAISQLRKILLKEKCSFTELPISLPKGRNSENQSVETVIKDELYQECKLLYDNVKTAQKRITIAYTDCGTRYNFEFMVGVMINDAQPYLDLADNIQCNEVSAIEWHSEDSIKNIETDDISKRVYVDNFGKLVQAGMSILKEAKIII